MAKKKATKKKAATKKTATKKPATKKKASPAKDAKTLKNVPLQITVGLKTVLDSLKFDEQTSRNALIEDLLWDNAKVKSKAKKMNVSRTDRRGAGWQHD